MSSSNYYDKLRFTKTRIFKLVVAVYTIFYTPVVDHRWLKYFNHWWWTTGG